MTLVLSFNSTLTFTANNVTEEAFAMAEKNSSICLFKETVLTADEAVKLYPHAYALISKAAVEVGIDVAMDDPVFQEYAKTYAFFEGEDDAIIQEVKDFVKFIDLYENTEKNEAILQAMAASATLAVDNEDLDIMMPIIGPSTIASGEIAEDAVSKEGNYDNRFR